MTGYTKGGKETNVDNPNGPNPQCYAKITGKETPLYHIRMDRLTHSFYDPDDVFTSGSTTQRIKGTDIERCPFVTVSKETFDHYLNFLKSGNRNNLLLANRIYKSP